MQPELQWVDAGRRFAFDDLVFWQARGESPLASVAGRIDTIVLGPHASAAFPRELEPFVAPGLTLRKQCDFSDCTTSSLGRAWARCDAHTVFIENPVSRLVLDANRAPPAAPLDDLREFFRRMARRQAGESVGFAGVDAVRPITFSDEPVLQQPADEPHWRALGEALHSVAARTVAVYRSCCDAVLEMVLAQRPVGAALRVISLHDTMNTKMRRDGAIVVERPTKDRLPRWANLGNRGDESGESGDEHVTLAGMELRRVAAAWGQALGLDAQAQREQLWLNRPYKGAYETLRFGERLRAAAEPRVGALQVEFLRETLLGPQAVAELHSPGDDWPAVGTRHIETIARSLAQAGQLLRQGGASL
jgi:N-formylglutamate amidohydrolase